jgi:RNA polymerase sigma factor (sigma-70 family)
MTLTRQEQAGLVARILNGDERGFDELFAALRRPVFGYIRVRSNNETDAQDIDQETWTNAWKKLAQYDPDRGSCLTYIKTIAWSTLVDYYRRKPREVSITKDLEEDLDIEALLTKLSPNHLNELPEAMRHLFEDAALRLVFEGSSPPHQLIVFGFVERLGWNPREVIADLSDLQLRKLTETLENEYIATSELSVDLIRRRFRHLRYLISQLVGDVVTEPKTREVCRTFLHLSVGDTLLRQYYTREANEISHWCQAVRRRATIEAVRRPDAKNIKAMACEKKSTRS